VLSFDHCRRRDQTAAAVPTRRMDCGRNAVVSRLDEPHRPGNQWNSAHDVERLIGNRAVHLLDAQDGFLHRDPRHVAVTGSRWSAAVFLLALGHVCAPTQ